MKDEYKRGLISVCIFVLIFFVFKLLVGVSAYDDGIEATVHQPTGRSITSGRMPT